MTRPKPFGCRLTEEPAMSTSKRGGTRRCRETGFERVPAERPQPDPIIVSAGFECPHRNARLAPYRAHATQVLTLLLHTRSASTPALLREWPASVPPSHAVPRNDRLTKPAQPPSPDVSITRHLATYIPTPSPGTEFNGYK